MSTYSLKIKVLIIRWVKVVSRSRERRSISIMGDERKKVARKRHGGAFLACSASRLFFLHLGFLLSSASFGVPSPSLFFEDGLLRRTRAAPCQGFRGCNPKPRGLDLDQKISNFAKSTELMTELGISRSRHHTAEITTSKAIMAIMMLTKP
ncbi:uncharacterized protein G2W53_000824 [Senna tora]|uniref:Uncharacterized protein n=1 Tax=Senna tora TaxID=362788 RepID=A0A834XGH0_9FABA|nr:uncharacterized protein G2W53_000824 [Senna tora]